MKKKAVDIDQFAQTPLLETKQYVLNKAKNKLDFVDYRNDIKYVNDNKNLTFKELIEKYGLVNVLKNQDRGIALDQTLLYNDINTMWNAGQNYQRQKQEITNKQQLEAQAAAEQLKNIEVNEKVVEVVNNDTTTKQ